MTNNYAPSKQNFGKSKFVIPLINKALKNTVYLIQLSAK